MEAAAQKQHAMLLISKDENALYAAHNQQVAFEANRFRLLKFNKNFLTTIFYLRKVKIYLLTSCNTEERIAQNIYVHNSNRNYKKINYNNNINQEPDRHRL